jgi:4-hydroxy-tetrahydrodipicolinate reductase
MLNLAIAGITGRMGQACISAANNDESVSIVVGTLPKGANILAPDFEVVSDLLESKQDFDVCIDFTTPESSILHAKACAKLSKGLVIGTTGFTETQFQKLQQICKDIPVLYSPNMSIGMNAVYALLEQAGRLLQNSNVDIIETHHEFKKDAPSGSALQMSAVLEKAMQKAINPAQSIRSGNIVGEHEVRFGLPFERISIKHEAFDRQVFAQGAIQAAFWLKQQGVGWYSIKDLLEFVGNK